MSPSAVAAKAASLLLRYPDQEVLALLQSLRMAVAQLPGELADPLGRVTVHRAATSPAILAAEYAELFDLHRRCCLYLSCYAPSDTRNRGRALLGFSAAFNAAGIRLGGEPPDFLPAVLELAAHAGEPGWRLLREHRIGLDLLEQALERENSVYRHVVRAIRVMLPPPRSADPATAPERAREPVGLEPLALGGPALRGVHGGQNGRRLSRARAGWTGSLGR